MKSFDAENALRETGLRATRQRITLLELLHGLAHPLPVEELVRKGKGAFDTATAYRILDAFVVNGLARRIGLAEDRALYEAALLHHHHAICRICGRIEDVAACLPPGLDARVKKTSGFARIEDHALEFFGVCKACA